MEILAPSKIKITWVRGIEPVHFKSPLVVVALGARGAGKSALLEAIAEHYLAEGQNVFDLFGASSGEGLAWLRSPWVLKEDRPVLLIRGEEVDVRSSWPDKSWKDMNLSDFERNSIVISSTPLYQNKDEEFKASSRLVDLLFSRYEWSRYIALIVRESANLFYSRMRLRQDQLTSKAESVYLVREARHHGLSMLLDTQRLMSIDIDLRSLSDYIVFKSAGMYALPRDFWFLYRYLRPEWLRNMKVNQFGIISRRGNIGVGINDMPTWHKRSRENILRSLGIHVEAEAVTSQ